MRSPGVDECRVSMLLHGKGEINRMSGEPRVGEESLTDVGRAEINI